MSINSVTNSTEELDRLKRRNSVTVPNGRPTGHPLPTDHICINAEGNEVEAKDCPACEESPLVEFLIAEADLGESECLT